MLNDRYQMLFKNLMGLYLSEGKPVGSTTLAKMPDVSVSSATVRNVLADLERMGLVHSPHTSAGRIPTDKGYRLFVDSFLTYQQPSEIHAQQIRMQLANDLNQDRLLQEASKVLSGMTGMTSLVMMPSKQKETLHQVDFLRLSDTRILVVLVFNDQDVQNRIVETEQEVSADSLQKLANFLNRNCIGLSMNEARGKLLQAITENRLQDDLPFSSLLHSTDSMIREQLENHHPLLVSGKTQLLNYQEFADSEKLRQLYNSFSQQGTLLELFDKSLQAPGLKVFIGSECGDELYQGCSLVTRPYEVEGQVLGVLGVIGPSRMNYQKVVPEVDVTAKILSSLLKK